MRTMTPGNFLQVAHDIEAGQGFWVEKETDFSPWRSNATTTPLSASTTPPLAYLFNSMPCVGWAASQSQGINLCYTVPLDFDASKDSLRIRVTGVMSGTTDSPTITASGFRTRAGDTTSAALTSVASDPVSGTTIAVYEILMTGNGLQPGDNLRITLTPGAHTTDSLYALGLAIGYKSSLVAYTKGERA